MSEVKLRQKQEYPKNNVKATELLARLLTEPYGMSIEQAFRNAGGEELIEEVKAFFGSFRQSSLADEFPEFEMPGYDELAEDISVEGNEALVSDETAQVVEAFIAFWYETLNEALQQHNKSLRLGPDLCPEGFDDIWQQARNDLFAQFRVEGTELKDLLHKFASKLTDRSGVWSPPDETFELVRVGETFEVRRRDDSCVLCTGKVSNGDDNEMN